MAVAEVATWALVPSGVPIWFGLGIRHFHTGTYKYAHSQKLMYMGQDHNGDCGPPLR